ncbi:MAG: DUF4157 domain-containing protein [Anaerolinea sp.]|nr:DUF4157 domain-containing protein [Anaerolinea sp.]
MAEVTASKTAPDKGNMPAQERLRERPSGAAPAGPTANILALHDQAGNQAVNELLRNGNGRPLDASVRAFMESRFNHDFSQVRVHTDAAAAQSTDSINANAYTVGADIVFGPGKFNVQTTAGRQLLAHELAHVVQQSRGGAPPELNAAAPHEQQAATAAQTFIISNNRVNVHGRTGVGLARDTKGESHPLPAAEPEDLWRQIQGLRGFDATDPVHALETAKDQVTRIEGELKLKPDDKALQKQLEKARKSLAQTQKRQAGPIDPESKGKPLGTGYSTYAAVQVLDADGKQVAVGIGKYDGTNHAEENAIKALRANLKGKSITGGRLMVVVDQVVCSKCQGSLKSFVGEQGLTHIDAYYPARGEVTPKTAARTSVKKGNETTLRHEVIGGEGSKQVAPTPKPQSAGSKPAATPKVTGDKSAVAPASKSPVTPKIPTAKIPSTPIAPKAPSSSAKAGATYKPSSGVGYAAGEAVGQIINQVGGMLIQKYVMDPKNEEAFRQKLEAKQVEIENHLNAHEKEVVEIQAGGKTAYINITLRVRYQTGPISPDGPSLTAFMGLDLENVKVSDRNIRTESSPKEGMTRSLMKEMFGQSETLLTYSVDLPTEPYLSKVKERQEKIRQQQKEKEELQKLIEKQQKNAPKPTPPPQPSQGAPTLIPSFTPSTSPSLLPGAPSMEGPIEQAARVVKAAESWAAKIEKQGTYLADRIHSSKPPTPQERQSYLDEERTWRLSVKQFIDEFRKQSRLEAVNKLEELLDRMGPKLHQFRIYFGGD